MTMPFAWVLKQLTNVIDKAPLLERKRLAYLVIMRMITRYGARMRRRKP
jgi:hypothetical protein